MSTVVLYDTLGPRGQARVRAWTVAGAALIAVVLAGAVWKLYRNDLLSGEVWSILVSRDFARLILDGAWATLKVSLVAIVLSFTGGAALAQLARSDLRVARILTRVWIEIFRGVPLLVLIFFIYLGLPAAGLTLSMFWSMAVAISLYNSAVMCEILRSGIESLPIGQTEAAYALGFRKLQAMRKVVLPQAIRVMLPSLIAQMVIVLKESSLGFVIGYEELLRNGRIVVDYTGTVHAIPVYVTIAAIYLSINLSLSRLARQVQQRNARA